MSALRPVDLLWRRGSNRQSDALQPPLASEAAARNEMPMHDDKCKATRSARSGNTFKFAMECAGPPKSSGEGEFTMVSAKETTGKMKFVTATRGGPAETMEMQQRARWISADCGALKPQR